MRLEINIGAKPRPIAHPTPTPPPALVLQVGKKYVTADGEVVGPLKQSQTILGTFVGQGWRYHQNGRRYGNHALNVAFGGHIVKEYKPDGEVLTAEEGEAARLDGKELQFRTSATTTNWMLFPPDQKCTNYAYHKSWQWRVKQ